MDMQIYVISVCICIYRSIYRESIPMGNIDPPCQRAVTHPSIPKNQKGHYLLYRVSDGVWGDLEGGGCLSVYLTRH